MGGEDVGSSIQKEQERKLGNSGEEIQCKPPRTISCVVKMSSSGQHALLTEPLSANGLSTDIAGYLEPAPGPSGGNETREHGEVEAVPKFPD